MRFYGYVGYGSSEQASPNVYDDEIHEYPAYGDVLQNIRKWATDADLNDDLTTQNRISLLATPFMRDNCSKIKYVRWLQTKWKVTAVTIQHPRIIVTLGGVYNE